MSSPLLQNITQKKTKPNKIGPFLLKASAELVLIVLARLLYLRFNHYPIVLINDKGLSHLILEEEDLVPREKQWKQSFS